jgi:anti-sigma factor (TIGR02949 family)
MVDERMSCERVLEHLLEYLDRELDAHTSAEIDRHLEECRGCFSRAEFERRLNARLRDSGSVPAPASLRARIKSLMERF